jgi:hypothetical protein
MLGCWSGLMKYCYIFHVEAIGSYETNLLHCLLFSKPANLPQTLVCQLVLLFISKPAIFFEEMRFPLLSHIFFSSDSLTLTQL